MGGLRTTLGLHCTAQVTVGHIEPGQYGYSRRITVTDRDGNELWITLFAASGAACLELLSEGERAMVTAVIDGEGGAT